MRPWERFPDALGFAARLHATQTRKGSGTPYIGHVLAVAAIVIDHGATEDEAIAALLHDAVEDQGGRPTLQQIRERYGDNVAAIVLGCTDAFETPKPPWCERKRAFISRLDEASPSVRLVVAADKLHNARAVLAALSVRGAEVWPLFNTGREGTLWYYRAVANSLGQGSAPADSCFETLLAELDQTVTTIEEATGGRASPTFCD